MQVYGEQIYGGGCIVCCLCTTECLTVCILVPVHRSYFVKKLRKRLNCNFPLKICAPLQNATVKQNFFSLLYENMIRFELRTSTLVRECPYKKIRSTFRSKFQVVELINFGFERPDPEGHPYKKSWIKVSKFWTPEFNIVDRRWVPLTFHHFIRRWNTVVLYTTTRTYIRTSYHGSSCSYIDYYRSELSGNAATALLALILPANSMKST